MGRIKQAAGRTLRRVSPAFTANLDELVAYRAEVHELRETVAELKSEIDQLRRDSLRVAELSDIVIERLGESPESVKSAKSSPSR